MKPHLLRVPIVTLLLISSAYPFLHAQAAPPLIEAIQSGDIAKVATALKDKPNVNEAWGDFKQTALHIALVDSEVRNIKIIDMLIAAGAKIDQSDSNNITPLVAFIYRHKNGLTPEDYRIIDRLVKSGANVNAGIVEYPGQPEITLMQIAIRAENLELMRSLISQGIEINPVLDKGCNYMHIVATMEYSGRRREGKMMQLLYQAGVDFDTPDDEGRTPLHYAANSGNETAIKQLLKFNPRIDLKDNAGVTPVDLALKIKGISEAGPRGTREKQRADLIRAARNQPKLTEIGVVFSAAGKDVDVTGPGINTIRSGQKLIVKTARGDYTIVAGQNMHTKLKATASPAASARLTKGDKVFRKQ